MDQDSCDLVHIENGVEGVVANSVLPEIRFHIAWHEWRESGGQTVEFRLHDRLPVAAERCRDLRIIDPALIILGDCQEAPRPQI